MRTYVCADPDVRDCVFVHVRVCIRVQYACEVCVCICVFARAYVRVSLYVCGV